MLLKVKSYEFQTKKTTKMSINMLSMFAPQLIKMAESEKVKSKILEVIQAKKKDYQTEPIDETRDIRLMLSATNNEIFLRVVEVDLANNGICRSLETFRYDDIIELVKKLL